MRRDPTRSPARSDKVARWHAKGRRTARENIADLVDPGSFVEYGRFITAAQERRRDLADLGMAGPAMIAGGGLGSFAPEEIGPVKDQTANGVIDLLVEDEAAAVEAVRGILSYLDPTAEGGEAGDQADLRTLLPHNDREAFDVRPVIEALADIDSVTWLREAYAPELVTALARIDGIAVGVIANQSTHLAGALTSEASVKAADFLALCERWGLPVISLVDTPGVHGRPGGRTRRPGPPRVPDGRSRRAAEDRVTALTEEYRKQASALNAARMFEIDDVIDPAETRSVIAATLRRA